MWWLLFILPLGFIVWASETLCYQWSFWIRAYQESPSSAVQACWRCLLFSNQDFIASDILLFDSSLWGFPLCPEGFPFSDSEIFLLCSSLNVFPLWYSEILRLCSSLKGGSFFPFFALEIFRLVSSLWWYPLREDGFPFFANDNFFLVSSLWCLPREYFSQWSEFSYAHY